MRNLRPANSETIANTAAEKVELLQAAVEQVIRGKPEAVRLAIVTLLAGGHLLIEDVPGVGKTTLAHALSRALDCSFQRIQFTSDLLPSDVIGLSVYNQIESLFQSHHAQDPVGFAGSHGGRTRDCRGRNARAAEPFHGPGHPESD
jgi:MoxR-like ATPase